jgi:outer membrane protein OmpA-like peptidoglycan-associated protein
MANPDCKIIEQSTNTDAHDFGTFFYNGKVVYASSNLRPKMIKRKYNWNGQPYLNLYIAEVKEGQLKKREFFNKDLNAKMHEGPVAFSNKGTVMAITKNNSKDKTKDKIVELQIHFSTLKDEKWSEPVPFIYNNPAYSVGHAYLLEDGNTMYFVSDMQGGFGGTDIYKTIKNGNNEWMKPENLGNIINTEGDEMFPFFEEKNQILSFSSTGHFGLGNLDIFNCMYYGSNWGFVENPGAPINTRFDDYAMISNADASKGYLSSNRAGGSGLGDIYAFTSAKTPTFEKMISGVAKDSQGEAIPGTFITLLGENDQIISTMVADNKGAYSFPVQTNQNFEITGNKDKYSEGSTITNSFGTEINTIADVILLQDKLTDEEEINEEAIVVNNDLANVIKLNPIYFDFDKSNIRQDAAKELDKIVKVMNKYPNMEVELTAHSDCRGSDSYNYHLSKRRAVSSVEYINSKIITPNRISGKGLGETKSISACACEDKLVSDCSPEDHQKNRRTEFIIMK